MIWQKSKTNSEKRTKQMVALLMFFFVLILGLALANEVYAQSEASTYSETKSLNEYVKTQVRHNGCYQAKAYTHISQTCYLCPSFRLIFGALNRMASLIYNQMAASLINLVAWGFIVWLSIVVLKAVSSVTAINPSEMISNMARQLFRVILVFAFFKVDSTVVFGLLIEPILSTSFGFATAASGATCPSFSVSSTSGVFSSELQNSFICLITSLQSIVGFFQGVGFYMICASWGSGILPLLPAFGPLISGCILIITMLIITFNFALKILDALFRLAIFCALMPLFVAAWAFDITKSFAQKGWEMLISIAVTFVCLALAITMSFYMFDVIFGSMTALISAVESDDLSKIAAFFDVTALTVVKVVVVCVFSCAIFSKAPSFGDHFAEANWSSMAPASEGGEQVASALDVTDKHSWIRGQMRTGAMVAKSTGASISKVRQAYGKYKQNAKDSKSQGTGNKSQKKGSLGKSQLAFAGAGGSGASNNKPNDIKTPNVSMPNIPNLGNTASPNVSGNSTGGGGISGGVGSGGASGLAGLGSGADTVNTAKNAAIANTANPKAALQTGADNSDSNSNVAAAANTKINNISGQKTGMMPPPLVGGASSKQPLDIKGFTGRVATSQMVILSSDNLTEEEKKEWFYKELHRKWVTKQRRKEAEQKKQAVARELRIRNQQLLEKKKKEQEELLKKLEKSKKVEE